MTDSQTDTRDAELAARRPQRERAFNIPTVVAALAAILVGIHLVRTFILTPDQDFELLVRAAFIPIRYTGGYDFEIYAVTSPVTYALLHGGFEHLIVNLIWMVAFGSPLAQRLGVARFLVFSLAATLSAVLLHFVLHSHAQTPLIGASGAIAGMMGAAARFGFRIDRRGGMPGFAGPVLPISAVLRQRGVLIFLLVWLAMNLVTGIFSQTADGGGIAWEAHVGGFLLGFFGIGLFDPPEAVRIGLEMQPDTAHDDAGLEVQSEGYDDSQGRNSR